jgi:uncharacterized membrane protein YeaQ/YmgE (transglycosylase-associated protein family)
MGIIWAIIIGFLAGVVAKLLTGGSREPRGFILTTVLGIVGSVLATWLGQQIGWLESGGSGVSFIAGVIGAVIILLLWRAFGRSRT